MKAPPKSNGTRDILQPNRERWTSPLLFELGSSRRSRVWEGTVRHFRIVGQTVRNASVGDSRAARSAGSKPAIAPVAIAETIPPAQAVGGMTTVHSFVLA